MEAFIHNMNTIHSRGGNQVVFSSINYGTDTSAEGRCIIRELLKSTYQGVGNGETAIFPIQIWKKKRGVSYLPEDRNYDLYQLACKVTARRFFPNFLNLDATFNQSEEWKADDPKRYQHEVATMGCRTRVFENRFGPKTSIGRGNISFSTINIVRLAIECMKIEDKELRIAKFFAKLDAMLEVTARQLHERMEFQKTAFAKQFPLLMSALWVGCEKLKPNDTIASVINQGTLGIGFIGLAECLVALTGKHHGESEEAQKLGVKIVTYMRDRADQFSDQYHHNYSVLATPAEGLSGKFTGAFLQPKYNYDFYLQKLILPHLPVLEVRLNSFEKSIQTPEGTNPEYLDTKETTSKELFVTLDIPADEFRAGNNTLTIRNISGSWVAFDQIKLTSASPLQTNNLTTKASLVSSAFSPVLVIGKKKELRQPVKIKAVNWHHKKRPVELQVGNFPPERYSNTIVK